MQYTIGTRRGAGKAAAPDDSAMSPGMRADPAIAPGFSHVGMFRVLGQPMRVRSALSAFPALLDAALGAFRLKQTTGLADPVHRLDYTLETFGQPDAAVLRNGARELASANDPGALVFALQQDLVVALQHLLPHLLFIHAAVLERAGGAVLLTAASGHGKSTLCWALLHHGFGYLSDELAPLDPHTMDVLDYPQGLNLKTSPPSPYPLPAAAPWTRRACYVPVGALPAPRVRGPLPLRALCFVDYSPDHIAPAVTPVSPAEACARLYPNTLNPLAHPQQGLDPTLAVATRVPCLRVASANLRQTAGLVAREVDALLQ